MISKKIPYDNSINFWAEATKAIEEMLKEMDQEKEPSDLMEEGEKRQDVVGQNGNDGLHYDMHKKAKATDYQIDGDHYAGAIQPIDFIVANDIPYREANVIKYVFRHKRKNGVVDLRKARHYINMLIEEYEKDAG